MLPVDIAMVIYIVTPTKRSFIGGVLQGGAVGSSTRVPAEMGDSGSNNE